MIYFIQAADGTGPIKIGCTDNIKRRLSQLEKRYGELRLLGITSGTFQDETRLHKQFTPSPFGREWFEHDEALTDYITTKTLSLEDYEAANYEPVVKPTSPPILLKIGTYYNVTEAAQQRNVAPRTIRQWLANGLPAVKVGQGNTNSIIHIDDLMAWQPAPVGKPKAKAANEAAERELQ